jgi:nitrate/nitrite-specific signal transduction histidine kinase
VPHLPPICVGNLINPDRAWQSLGGDAHVGIVGELIRNWKLHYVENTAANGLVWTSQKSKPDYMQFIESEGIKSFVFLPIYYHHRVKLGALFLNYRTHKTLTEDEQRIIEACGMLIGAHLTQVYRQTRYPSKKRAAIAHTLYGNAAAIFKGNIDALETEIMRVMGGEIPSSLVPHFKAARTTVFEVVRNLVIDSSEDFLVDLNTMSLSEALTTTAAALMRAWPKDRAVDIRIHSIAPVIERLPIELRKLLYILILEAIANGIKHGGPAPFIDVSLDWADSQIYTQVIDHGLGFDRASRPFSDNGLGFWQHYIVEQLAGELNVSSRPGYGTTVIARIPVISVRRQRRVSGIKD